MEQSEDIGATEEQQDGGNVESKEQTLRDSALDMIATYKSSRPPPLKQAYTNNSDKIDDKKKQNDIVNSAKEPTTRRLESMSY